MIKVGTSGFSFPDWKRTIYPKEIKDREMLTNYERELDGRQKTLIFFNNCHGGSAGRNAMELLRMLS